MSGSESGERANSLGKFTSLYNFFRGRYLFKIIGIALVALVIILAISAVVMADVEDSVEADATESLSNSVEGERDDLSEYITEMNRNIIEMSTETTYILGDRSEIRGNLNSNFVLMPSEAQDAHFVSLEDNEIVASTDPVAEQSTVDPETHPWALDPDDFFGPSSFHVVGPYPGDETTEMAFISPVAGRATHAIVVTIDLAALSETLQPPIDGAVVEVISQDQQVVLSTETETLSTESFLAGELDGFDEESVGTVTADGDIVGDDSALVATAPIEEQNWRVAVIAPESAVFETADQIRQSLLLLIGVAAIALLAVGAVVSRDISRSLDQMTGYAEEIENENFDVEIDQSRRDEFGDLSVLFDRIRNTLKEQLEVATTQAETAKQAKEDAEVARERAEAAKQEAEELTDVLQTEATQFSEEMHRAAAGDLTCRLSTESDNEAMQEIADAFNLMMDDLEGTILDIQAFSQEVAAASEQADTGAQEAKRASADMTQVTDRIADGAEQQRDQLTAVSDEMTTLSATVEEAASTARSVANTSQETAEIATEGEETATAAIEEMEEVNETIATTVERVEELDALADEIDEIVELIADIADQTNMLALNANIEAARAGSGGDGDGAGFGVVADEVKTLADETRQSAAEVADLLEEVQSQTETTVSDIRTAQTRVAETTESVDATVDAFVDVSENIRETDDGVQEITDAIEQQAKSAESVVTMVEDVAEISEDTADDAEEVSAGASEQAASMNQISMNITTLAEQAENLQQRLETFEVDASTGDGASDSAEDESATEEDLSSTVEESPPAED